MNELLALVDADLADDVHRCAAAAGYSVLPADQVSGDWLRADAVVVDPGAVDRLASMVPRRGVFLVSAAPAPPRAWQAAVALGAGGGFALPADEEGLVAALTGLRTPARADGRVLAILGGHGGSGATTLAAATAMTTTDTRRGVLLVSPDRVGAGVDLILGIEDVDGPRAGDLNAAGGRISHEALHQALPRSRGMAVLAASGGARPVRGEAVIAAVDAGRSGGDTVVVDVPRTDPALRDDLLVRADLVVIVGRGTLPALAAARATRDSLPAGRAPVELVLRGPAPGGIPVEEMAWAVGLPLLGFYRSDPSLPARLESRPLRPPERSPLGEIGRRLCDRLDEVAA
ncbi:MAG: hypothetical protein QM728_01400 [Gordonia sp. (in: high G+C Gram-positive bacteria)]|uniref:septum site-determining protein Ssd n=1 Tax=Gordonia sp. (in: high G+C Gram-positive bacteria) TaxID=84139 RepID=UPI0039E2636E